LQVGDGVVELFEDALDDVFSAFVDCESDVLASYCDVGDRYRSSVDTGVFEHSFRIHTGFVECCVIFFCELVAWVHDCVRECAIVCEDEEAFCVFVETAGRVDAFFDIVFLDQRRECVRSWFECCDVSWWLMQRIVCKLLESNFLSIDSYCIVRACLVA